MARKPTKSASAERVAVKTLGEAALKYQATVGDLVPTGIINLDVILGGGFPKGSFVEIASPSGLGKTTLMTNVAKNYCGQGLTVHWFDFEHGLTHKLLESVGLLPYLGETFIHFDPITYGDAEEIMETYSDDNYPDIIIIDSETAMLPDRLADLTILNMEPGVKSRMTSNFMIKFKGWCRKRGITIVFINQMRVKINFNMPSTEDSAGGLAFKFYCDIRLRMKKSKDMVRVERTAEGEKKITYGCEALIWAVKNREVRSHIELTLPIVFGKGVSNIQTIKNILMGAGYASSSGSYFKISMPGLWEGNVQGNKGFGNFIKERRADIDKFILDNDLLFLVKEIKDADE